MMWWPLLRLRSKNSFTRQQAAEKLGNSKDPSTIEPLEELLIDDDKRVREAAAIALGKIVDNRTIAPLARALGDGSYAVAYAAALALNNHPGVENIAPLLNALKHRRVEVRRNVAKAIGEIGDRRAVESLLILLEDKDFEVRKSAIEALGQIGDTRAVEPLIALLNLDLKVKSPFDQEIAWVDGRDAMIALGMIGDVSVIVPLLNKLDDDFPFQKQGLKQAIKKLRKVSGNERVTEELIAGLKCAPTAAKTALEELESTGWQPSNEIEGGLAAFARRDVNELAKLGSIGVELLVNGLKKWNLQSARAAAETLDKQAWEPRDQAERVLFDLVTDRTPSDEISALGDESAELARSIGKLLFDGESNDKLRSSALKLLGRIGGCVSAEVLMAVVNYPVRVSPPITQIWDEAALALGTLGDKRAANFLIKRWLLEKLGSRHSERSLKLYTSIIQDALERSAGDIESNVLRQILSLGEIRSNFMHYDHSDDWGAPTFDVVVDSSRIKELAKNELMRRGKE